MIREPPLSVTLSTDGIEMIFKQVVSKIILNIFLETLFYVIPAYLHGKTIII